IELQAMQPSPCHVGLADLRPTVPSSVFRFPYMRWSLMPFDSGKYGDPGMFLRIPPSYGGDTLRRDAAHHDPELAADDPAVMGQPFASDLVRRPSFAIGMQQLDTVAVRHARIVGSARNALAQ